MRRAWLLAGVGLRGRRKAGTVATFAVMVLAAVAMASGLVVSRQGAPLLDAAADEANVAHLVLYGTADALEAAASDPAVVAWSGPFAALEAIELLIGAEEVPMELTALENPDIEVNGPPMIAGRWAAAADEIVVDHSLSDDLGIGLGDAVRMRRSGAETTFAVVGTAVNFTDCFYPQCEPAHAWVTDAGLARFDATDEVYQQGWFRLADAAEADPFVEQLAVAGVPGIGGSGSWLDTRDDFLTLDRIFGSFVSAFGVFVLAVAAVVVAGSMAMRVVTRRREIGLLGAVGCTPRQITSGLLVENLGVGIAAGVLGWFLAGFLAPSLQLGIGRTLGPQDPSWTLLGLVVTISAITVILLVATLVPAVGAARRPVTDVLRDVPPSRVSALSRHASGLPRRLSLLGVRDLVSQPTRAALAALAVVVAVVGSLVSFGFIAAVGAVADDPATAGDPWDVAVLRGEVSVAEVEEVLAATSGVGGWFSETEERATLDDGVFLAVGTGGEPDAAAYEIVDGRAMTAAGEGIAGYGFLERFDASVGDEVDIQLGTTALSVEIVGMYRDTEDSGEVLRYRMETLTEAEPTAEPQLYRIAAADGAAPDALAAELTERLGPGVRTEVLDTGVQDLEPLLMVLRLVALVLLLVAGTNLLSTLLTANQESAGRIGVQLALGFTPRQVVIQGGVAGAGLGMVAVVIGVPLGLWLFQTLSDVVSRAIGVGPGWMAAPSAGLVAVFALLAVVVSAGLGAVAVARISRRPASDLVRTE